MKRLALALVGAVAVTTLLSGCLQWFQPPTIESTSQPTNEEVAADLVEYYHQVLTWQSCGGGLLCTTARAPMDWANPAEAEIELALVRHPATGTKLGSLLVNPGGPGGSGYDFVYDSVDYATSATLQGSYDIVGFDPRGVGRSSAVSCYDDPAFLDTFNYGDGTTDEAGPIGSDAWIADLAESNAEFAAACLEFTGPLLQFVDTVSAARDLDLLRAVLGDEKLNFLGYSYGTFLGATYADLYPQNTGHLVLDGAIDPSTTDFEVTKTQAVGFESAFRAYLEDCVTREACPFGGTVDDAMVQTGELLGALNEDPIRAPDGRLLWGGTMFIAIILPLYNQESWPFLDDLFTEVAAGDTTTAFFLADNYNGRNSDGTYRDNSTEAFISINCLDYESVVTNDTMRAEAASLAEAAPIFGPVMSYGGTLCESWPFPPTRQRVDIVAEGSADILVLGTTNDPATPYVWAVALADQLENGHLVTYEGEGHTAYTTGNPCVQGVVDAFFIDDVVPSDDPRC
ncbi:alpha/beta hydrolase [Pseudolysinimonas sp.]|jgi:pimeloyl-ACP methyl ester carboxylesterase|uniref:alpha/beta hydrolase n=1 Tax=Pseudolysinimonas sp. TaxID=2680009 RepID=UPI0037852A7D